MTRLLPLLASLACLLLLIMTVMYSGLALLIASSIWNGWPPRPANSCPECAPRGNELVQLSAKEKKYEPKTQS